MRGKLFRGGGLAVVDDFTARRIVFGDDKVERLQDVAEAGTRERHGLGGHEIDRVVGLDEEQAGLAEQGRFFDAGAGYAFAR